MYAETFTTRTYARAIYEGNRAADIYIRITANSLTQQINMKSITFARRPLPRALHAFIPKPDLHTPQSGNSMFVKAYVLVVMSGLRIDFAAIDRLPYVESIRWMNQRIHSILT